MTTKRPSLEKPTIAAVLVFLTLGASFLQAGELDYIIVDRMPDIRGELERSIEGTDETHGLSLTQDLYTETFEHAWIKTFVITASCKKAEASTDRRHFLLAIKYPPKKPATFAIAGLHDVYKEVYVRDRKDRIRLYEDVSAQSMIELSDTFLPLCLNT